MTETVQQHQEKERLTLGDFDTFDKIWLLVWVGLVYVWPLWALRGPDMQFLSYLFAALFLTIFLGLPLALIGSQLRGPIRRLCGLTTATASQNYQR